MGQQIYLDSLVWLSWGLGLLLTFVCVWFDFGQTDLIMKGFVIMCLGGWGLIAVARRVGLTRGGVVSGTLVAIALFLMWLESLISQQLFDTAYTSPGGDVWTAVLFAIYEETLFLSFAVAGNAAGLPGIYTLVFSALAFVPLHGLARPDELAFNMSAFMVRMTLSGMTVYTHFAGPAFAAHALWNFVVSI